MISPFNLLLLACVAATSAMAVTWLLRRRHRDDTDPAENVTGSESATAEPADDVPHPATLIPAAVPIIDQFRSEPGEPTTTNGERATATAVVDSPPADDDRTLTDVLEGIQLPYDLMPVTSVVDNPDRHLIFLTTHSNAGEVGKKFADELERLGFEMESVDFDQAVAARDDDVVSMKIVPEAHLVEVADELRYGAAGPGDVALEVWFGRSPVPPSATE